MEERLPRKLAAILYADVAGYSRLTGDDEDATHRRLRDYLDVISSTIESHHGQVMHYAGDAVLAKFDAVVDALSSAVAIQNELKDRNQDLPDERKVQFRIGVNLGDVIEDRGDIYGDGVNVAARLESLADEGGICISESVRTAIGKKLDLGYEPMGEQQVKNIEEPVRAYKVALDANKKTQVTSPDKPMLELPDKPSIAVLAFTNMSGDPEQEYFSDGVTEDIITELSKFRNLLVIARNSSFQYRGQSIDIKRVGEDLRVRYVLEGSVRKAGNRIRITAQLVDALSGHHIWADRFDRQLEDVFAIQDEVAQSVVGALTARLEEVHFELAKSKGPADMRAYDFWLRGKRAFNEFSLEGMDRAIELFKRAIEIDPKYARGYANLGFTYNMRTSYSGWGKPIDEAHERALELAKKAVALDESDHWNQLILGWCYLFRRKYGEAQRHYDKSISINPNDAEGLVYRASFLGYNGQQNETIECLEQAFRLNPLYPDWYLDWAIVIYLTVRQTEKALEVASKRSEDVWPETPGWLAVLHAHTGSIDQAHRLAQSFVANVRRLWVGEGVPDDATCLHWLFVDNPLRYQEDIEWITEGFRIAGLKV